MGERNLVWTDAAAQISVVAHLFIDESLTVLLLYCGSSCPTVFLFFMCVFYTSLTHRADHLHRWRDALGYGRSNPLRNEYSLLDSWGLSSRLQD